MKRLNSGAIAGMTVALSTFTPSSSTGAEIGVAVRLANSADGVCILVTPKNASHPDFHVVAVRRDTVKWNIRNDCTRLVKVGISSFRPLTQGQQIDHPMDEASSTLSADIAAGASGAITATVKRVINNYGRTRTIYVYDFEEIQPPPSNYRVPFADPEIEIP